MQTKFTFDFQGWGVAALLALTLTACGGGGGSDAGSYDPAAVSQALEGKIRIGNTVAVTRDGAPPAPSGLDTPKIKEISAPEQVAPGTTVDIPLGVTTQAELQTLFAKIPGSDNFFAVPLQSTASRSGAASVAYKRRLRHAQAAPQVTAKADAPLSVRIALPVTLENGRLCIDFSVQDVTEAVSNQERICVNVQRPAPTAAPTSPAQPTAAPTPAATATPTPPAGNDTAAACFGAHTFAVGTTVEQTFDEENTFLGRSRTQETYTVTGETTFNGQSALELAYQYSGGGLIAQTYKDYINIDPGTPKIIILGDRSDYETCTNQPAAEYSFGLKKGASTTQTYTTHCNDGGENYSATNTVKLTYLGRERITVPAGTFNTCAFEQQISGQDEDATSFAITIKSWLSVGDGLQIKLESTGLDHKEELVSARINGQPVQPQ